VCAVKIWRIKILCLSTGSISNEFKKGGVNENKAITRWGQTLFLMVGLILGVTTSPLAQSTNKHMGIPEDVDPIHQTYIPVVTEGFETIMKKDVAEKPDFMKRQIALLKRRYDLQDAPSEVKMSGGTKPVQKGVRVRLPEGMTWDKLSGMSAHEIKEKDVFPEGFLPLPHAKHETGGQVIPENHIEEIMKLEKRNLKRFDVAFDLPQHFTPEFPPPIFLTNRACPTVNILPRSDRSRPSRCGGSKTRHPICMMDAC
jgi:hypothetical protein